MIVTLVRLPHAADLPLPAYATAGAAGMDLQAALLQEVVLHPGQRAAVATGLCIALPGGWEAQVRPRSGLALKNGITLLNAPGTVDADYRGEIKVILYNAGETPFTISHGMRVAQLVVAPVTRVVWQEADGLPESVRGMAGFGSTGLL